jgi:hypothetical protein
MDAPERIWAVYGRVMERRPETEGLGTEYVRADLIEAQAAQLQEAREIIASQLEALEEFGISGGAMPEARAFLAK